MSQKKILSPEELNAGREMAWELGRSRAQKARKLHAEGLTKGQIAKRLGVGKRSVYNYLKTAELS